MNSDRLLAGGCGKVDLDLAPKIRAGTCFVLQAIFFSHLWLCATLSARDKQQAPQAHRGTGAARTYIHTYMYILDVTCGPKSRARLIKHSLSCSDHTVNS